MLFKRKVLKEVDLPTWDKERMLDIQGCSGKSYNFTESISIALDFYFKALHEVLPPEQQSLVIIDEVWKKLRIDQINPWEIEGEKSDRSRIVCFGWDNDNSCSYRVVLVKRQGDEEWKVVGFHYPREEEDRSHPNRCNYYAVFEPHHYWFSWRTESGYLSPLVNPDY